ncbi:XRE family transcriptional regulator [Streptomyces sp. AJS327]|nr:XRE family transcriptional regulator [Streptomyces sp. AJS327]
MSLEALSGKVNISTSRLSLIETAEHTPPPELPALLDELFGTGAFFQKLYELVRREDHADRHRRWTELEQHAVVLEEYAENEVPRLLQTEGYARALLGAEPHDLTPEELEDRVTTRMARQGVLGRTPTPRFSAILHEPVLRRPIGGTEVMRGQLVSLLAMVDTRYSTLRVLPRGHGEHAPLAGSVTLLTRADGPLAVWEESSDAGTLLETMESTRPRRHAYDRLRSHALSPRDSARLIRSVMEAW